MQYILSLLYSVFVLISVVSYYGSHISISLHIVISFSILSFCLSYVMNASMHSGIHIFIYSFLYSYLFISFTYSCHVFMNTSIPIAFSIFSLFHAYDIWNFIYLYRNTDVFTHHSCILVPLRIYVTQELESIQSDHPN